jgi:hypothetical protein
MNITFPADHELLAFFETEPKVLDPNVPWFYNTLAFEVEPGGFEVHCRLSPAYGDIDVRLHLDGTELARVSFQSFKSLKLYIKAEGKVLVATFDRGQREETFGLMLKPRVWLGMGDFQGVPPGLRLGR